MAVEKAALPISPLAVSTDILEATLAKYDKLVTKVSPARMRDCIRVNAENIKDSCRVVGVVEVAENFFDSKYVF